jgi:hypothetical protein
MSEFEISRRTLIGSGVAAGLGLSGLAPASGASMAALPPIPVFDARDVGPVGHARARLAIMRALLKSCLGTLPSLEQWGVVGLDAAARKWLAATGSAYIAEIDDIAGLLPEKGVFLINAAYEWGCTTLAAPAPDGKSARLFRTLDWDFDGLGRHVEVARQQGPGGDYYNVTWPGAVGVLTAMAPGRFAASINKGPLPTGAEQSADGMPNLAVLKTGVLPSMHLLRKVFDQATDFTQARTMLEQTSIAASTIFTLAGLYPDQTCVIERKPDDFVTHMGTSIAANTWNYASLAKQWPDEKDDDGDSASRRNAIAPFAGRNAAPFAWVKPPLRNGITRLAVEADPAKGSLRVRGYEVAADDADAVPVTADLEIG